MIYYSYPSFADCDFPLIKALQDKGVDVHYYMPLNRNFQRRSILEFKKPLRKMKFIKASQMEEMQIYKDCIDLNRLYFIVAFPMNKFWLPSWFLWIYTLFHMKRQKADIIHIDWQYKSHFEKFLFRFCLGKKKILTVHDPIMHSGTPIADKEEAFRLRTFRWANHFILLNVVQANEFEIKYKIPDSLISYSRLPNYDSISKVELTLPKINGDYILFFGQILPYKGLEYLLDAMLKVHDNCPNLKLVIAGGGELYFDLDDYKSCDYIVWIHQYIGVRELAGLLLKSSFVVCPYKDATQSGVIQTSFAMGTPVLATNVGALATEVIHNTNGILVPPCNSVLLADAIISLYNDKNKLQLLRSNIMIQNKKNETNTRIAAEYYNIYQKVLNNRIYGISH